jgi:hypothetical protein
LLAQDPVLVLTAIFAGQLATGASTSVTVTVNAQMFVLPAASVAVQTTVVTPLAKALPLAGTHTMLSPAQLSAVVAEKVTLLEHEPVEVFTARFAGQLATGASASVTVTVNVQMLVLPLASVAVQTTMVTPLAKALPLAGTHTMLSPGQLSVVVATKVTLLEHEPVEVFTARSAGQLATGASASVTVTVNAQMFVFPAASVAVQTTVVTPLVKALPLAGTHTMLSPGQLSVVVAL